MAIVGTLPYTLANGATADASQVMANYNYIVGQVNANAAPTTAYSGGSNVGLVPTGGTGSTYLKGDGTWAAPAGSGNVSTSGSPAQHQLALFSSGTEITGITVPVSGTILQGVATADPTFTATPTLGVQQTTQGTLTLANTAAGSYATTLQSSNSATAAVTLTLPPAPPAVDDYVLSAKTTGVMAWVAQSGGGGGMVYPGAGLPVSTGSAWGTSITLGTGVAAALAANVTGSGGIVLATAPTITGQVLAAGTASVAPLTLTSGTNLTTPSAGALEYDGHAPYFSPVAGVRSVVPAFQHSHVTASGGVTLANVNTAQSFLPSGAQNFPVEAGIIYRFRAKILLNMNTTTTCVKNFLIAVAGGAAFSWIDYLCSTEQGASAGGSNSPTEWHNTTAAESVISTSSQAEYLFHTIEGSFVMTSGGTIQPQVQFSAAPGGTCPNMQGSFFELYAYGSASASAGLS